MLKHIKTNQNLYESNSGFVVSELVAGSREQYTYQKFEELAIMDFIQFCF